MLTIVTLPTKSLREPSVEIDKKTLLLPKTQKLISDMFLTMYAADGIGLAAPQVAQNIRIFTIGKNAIPKDHDIWKAVGGEWRDLAIANPTWEKMSKKTDSEMEGCLSVPGKIGRVRRFKHIHVKAWGQDGKKLSFDATGFFARVVQHEIDHLDGILFIDKASDIRDDVKNEGHVAPENIAD